jgi:aspartyl-tRNA(Asn)/glutamyl-tRNA(Gln) amidotransferase subunit B
MYETVIGLEVHVQLNTKTKAFCGCANVFGSRENTNICPVCLGLPGSLPVLNANALKSSVKVALAFNCAIRNFIKFDRKHYYYPDLPKNFQISQYDEPLSENGYLDIETAGSKKRIAIKRIHLEEDAGKLIHAEHAPYSFVDFNRAGTPLLEIVSEPDLNSPQEAYAYLSDLKLTLKYLDISDCDMEKGSLRCDANISLRPAGEKKLGVKTELKNMNSFKAVKAGLEFEIKRQTKCLEASLSIVQETRLWDEKKQETFSMRSKEEAHDYRYFPEPDLPLFSFTLEEIDEIRKQLPELPKERRKRFVSQLEIPEKSADVLIADKKIADFFEECLRIDNDSKNIANWLIGPVLSHANIHESFEALQLSPARLVELNAFVRGGAVSNLVAKSVLDEMLKTGKAAKDIIQEKNLGQISGADELKDVIESVIAGNKKSVEDYLAGKENALMFLVGQVMRMSGGKANPKVARDLLTERLKQ